MRYKLLFAGLFVLFTFQYSNTTAQKLEIGLAAGGAAYIGDLNQTQYLKVSGPSAGAYLKINLDPYWAVGLHYNFGKVKANDLKSSNAYEQNRALNFSTSLNEVSLQADFNFLEYFAGGGTKNFTPYIFTGVGLVFFSPKGNYQIGNSTEVQEYRLRFYQTEGQANAYRNFALSVPYGLGAKFRIKDSWGLFTQIGYRTAFTDYLDDVSGVYADPNVWPADENRAIREKLSNPSSNPDYGRIGTQRGDFRKRDSYMFVGVGISFTFVSQKCYTF
ncbi:type IX secretion system protein PorG [Pedobacter sp. UYP24]